MGKNLMPNFSMDIWDIYYMMKPSTDLDDYIPPFKAEATLYAHQHITTFDGRHILYDSGCNFLLSRDFVDGNFTVVANRDAETKQVESVTVTTAHNEKLEIYSNNKVTINGHESELPTTFVDGTITLQGSQIVLEGKRGYKVMFNQAIQLYTVQIN